MSTFSDQVMAVTGAAGSIGLAIAQRVFSMGAKVSIADVNSEGLVNAQKDLLAANPSRSAEDILVTTLDVRSSKAVDDWIAATMDKFGRLDAGINVAGVTWRGTRLRDLSDDEWDRTMGVNASGVFYCMRAQLRVMTPGARIVNMSSTGGVMGVPGCSAYGASKRGVIGLTTCAAREEGPNGIRINAVAPGYIDSDMTRSVPAALNEMLLKRIAAQPIARKGQPEDVAGVVVFLLGEDSSFMTGQVLVADGGSKP